MDTTNGHNPNLVKAINELWENDHLWWETCLIMSALMHRDGSTILEQLDKEVAFYENDEAMVHELGQEYLQRIADDTDLRVILDFTNFNFYNPEVFPDYPYMDLN